MSKPQKVVTIVAGLLLLLNFAFPYAQYRWRSDMGVFPILRGEGFVPVWRVLADQPKPEEKALFPVTAIEWPTVFAIAIGVVLVWRLIFSYLAKRPKPSETEARIGPTDVTRYQKVAKALANLAIGHTSCGWALLFVVALFYSLVKGGLDFFLDKHELNVLTGPLLLGLVLVAYGYALRSAAHVVRELLEKIDSGA